MWTVKIIKDTVPLYVTHFVVGDDGNSVGDIGIGGGNAALICQEYLPIIVEWVITIYFPENIELIWMED